MHFCLHGTSVHVDFFFVMSGTGSREVSLDRRAPTHRVASGLLNAGHETEARPLECVGFALRDGVWLEAQQPFERLHFDVIEMRARYWITVRSCSPRSSQPDAFANTCRA